MANDQSSTRVPIPNSPGLTDIGQAITKIREQALEKIRTAASSLLRAELEASGRRDDLRQVMKEAHDLVKLETAEIAKAAGRSESQVLSWIREGAPKKTRAKKTAAKKPA